MPRPRSLMALAFFATGGGLCTSCVAMLGLNEQRDGAVEKLCKCDEVRALRGGNYDACVTYFTARLNGASEVARAEWMKAFDSVCANSCGEWPKCIGLAATCTLEGNACMDSTCSDCCDDTTPPGPCQAGS